MGTGTVNGFKFLAPVGGFLMAECEIRDRLYCLRELDGAQMEAIADLVEKGTSEVYLGLATVGAMLSDKEGKRLYPSIDAAVEDLRRLPRGVLDELGAAAQRMSGSDAAGNSPSVGVS